MNKIKQLRIEKKISQEDLEEITGISRALLSHYETGRSTPNVENALKLAKAFGVTVEDLFGPGSTNVKEFVDEIGSLSKGEKEVISKYRTINPTQKAMVGEMLEAFTYKNKK